MILLVLTICLKMNLPYCFIIFPDNRNTYKTNSNTKISILMSKNIGQRRLNFYLEYFDALFYHHFQPNKI